MVTAAQTQELLDDLDVKVAQLKEAVQEMTEASGRVPQPEQAASGEESTGTANGEDHG
jgi:hypothetical protein